MKFVKHPDGSIRYRLQDGTEAVIPTWAKLRATTGKRGPERTHDPMVCGLAYSSDCDDCRLAYTKQEPTPEVKPTEDNNPWR